MACTGGGCGAVPYGPGPAWYGLWAAGGEDGPGYVLALGPLWFGSGGIGL